MRIQGATALVTGATGGLGQAIARELHVRGATLILTGRRLDVLEPLAAELDARALAVDLSEAEEVERLAREVGEVDVLVANAALPASGTLESFSLEELDRALEVNLRAPIALAHSLLPAMRSRGAGHLVFISSLSGKAATPGASLYNATKFGLRGFAGGLRADLRGSGIGVSCVFPGFIREAGMFADAGVSLPPGVSTRSPQDVARAVAGAIERDRGEVDVAPLTLRAGSAFAGLAPELAMRLARLLGSDKIAREMNERQAGKR